MTYTAKQIREARPEGTMSKVSGANDIVFTNGVTFTLDSQREVTKLWNKLRGMGYDIVRNSDSDEFNGLCQANKLGVEFPEPTMLVNN